MVTALLTESDYELNKFIVRVTRDVHHDVTIELAHFVNMIIWEHEDVLSFSPAKRKFMFFYQLEEIIKDPEEYLNNYEHYINEIFRRREEGAFKEAIDDILRAGF